MKSPLLGYSDTIAIYLQA